MNSIPPWLEKLLIEILNKYVPAGVVRALVLAGKDQLVAYLKALAAKTDNKVDDAIVAIIDEALAVELAKQVPAK